MFRKMIKVGAVAAAALIALTLLTGAVLAKGPGGGGGYGPPEETGHETAVAVAAELTGLTPEEVEAELAGGKTIPVFLEEHGVALADFHEAMWEAREAVAPGGGVPGDQAQERAGDQIRERAQDGTCEPIQDRDRLHDGTGAGYRGMRMGR